MNAIHSIAVSTSLHIRYNLDPSSGTIHATMLDGARQTIAVQRGFFCAITGVSRQAVLGATEVTPAIAAALGFIVPVTEGAAAI